MSVAIVGLAVLCAIAPVDGAIVERWFSTGVYPAIQRVVTPVSNLAPFALFDLLTIGGVVAIAAVLIRSIRRSRQGRRLRPLLAALGRIGTAAAVVYLLFLVFWGFNYRRVPMTERLVMERAAPDAAAVFALGSQAVQRMNELHAEAHRIGWPDDPRTSPELLEAYAFVQRRLSDAPLAVPGRLKRTLYGPYFRWTSVDGMVNPLALEVLANPDLLPYERPAVAAHEWAHLAGYADESEANFVGWLTCVRADVPAQYSAWLNLYWEVSGDLSTADRARLGDALDAGAPRRRRRDHRTSAAGSVAAAAQRQLARLRPLPARQPRRGGRTKLRRGGHSTSSRSLRGRLDSRPPDGERIFPVTRSVPLGRPVVSPCFIRSRAISSGVRRPAWS